jgi:hypothetical protein
MERTGVFISHAHEDRDLAASLARLLEAALDLDPAAITCTSDADYGLHAGGELREQISERLDSARALFLLATPNSRGREWVQYECAAIADDVRERKLQFYIVTPLRTPEEVVPAPYAGQVIVTLCDAEDVFAFVKEIRPQFGLAGRPFASFVAPMMDLIDRSARVELSHVRSAHEKELARTAWHRRMVAGLAVGCALLLTAAGVTAAWAFGIRDEAERQRQASEQQRQASEAKLSAQLRDAQLASDEAFKQFSFSGLVHDSRDRRLRCSEVEAFVRDATQGGERMVPKSCDGGGTFAFSAPELKNDARDPIRLRVHVGHERPYEFVVRLAEAQLALKVSDQQ